MNLEVVYSENCKSILNVPSLIEVLDPPEADFTYTPTAPSNLNPQVQFNNTSMGNISDVLWDFGNGTTSESYAPETTFNLPGIYDVELWVTSSNDCIDSTTQQITVNSQVNMYIPNAFSPNRDGTNDLFEIHAFGPILEYEIIIFDRWGGVMYQSDNIDDSWNGDFPNGEKCINGVYIYIIKYAYQGLGEDLFIEGQKAGDITILR